MGKLTLPSSGAVYLDAGPIIYSVEKILPYSDILQPLWLAAREGNFKVIGSELLLLETLVKPKKEADMVLEDSFRNLLLFSREFQLLPINLSVIETAINLRATTRIKTPDAIHAATALNANCSLFVTNDSIFGRIQGLPMTLLSEVIA